MDARELLDSDPWQPVGTRWEEEVFDLITAADLLAAESIPVGWTPHDPRDGVTMPIRTKQPFTLLVQKRDLKEALALLASLEDSADASALADEQYADYPSPDESLEIALDVEPGEPSEGTPEVQKLGSRTPVREPVRTPQGPYGPVQPTSGTNWVAVGAFLLLVIILATAALLGLPDMFGLNL
ncbi:MAG TPA: hypothetical protein VLA05_03405 [Coriobacteriia bacterium]|nr:hypothetical protein [Coriobacteriia bacterium]